MLSQKQVKEALKAYDWPLLQKHLESTTFDKTTLDELLGHIGRFNEWVFPYPNAQKEPRRAQFCKKLEDYATKRLGAEVGQDVQTLLETFDLVERGYRSLLEVLEQCDISQLPSNRRIAASIKRASESYNQLVDDFKKAMAAGDTLGAILQGPFCTADGDTISPDGALTCIVEYLTNTLFMEAHKNGWFDERGVVVLPVIPEATDDDCFKAGSTEMLANLWRIWRRTERRLRYLGGHMEILSPPNLPEGLDEGVETAIVFKPTRLEYYDYIANERLNDRSIQNFAEMNAELAVAAKIADPNQPQALPPKAFVSAQEAYGAISLTSMLCYSIADDRQEVTGLRIIEWLRGYAILKRLIDSGEEGLNEIADATKAITYPELEEKLCLGGLTKEKKSEVRRFGYL